MKIKTKFLLFINLIVIGVVLFTGAVLYFFQKKAILKEVNINQVSLLAGLRQVAREGLLVNDDLLLLNYLKLIKGNNNTILYGLVEKKDGFIIAHDNSRFINMTDLSFPGITSRMLAGRVVLQEFVVETGEIRYLNEEREKETGIKKEEFDLELQKSLEFYKKSVESEISREECFKIFLRIIQKYSIMSRDSGYDIKKALAEIIVLFRTLQPEFAPYVLHYPDDKLEGSGSIKELSEAVLLGNERVGTVRLGFSSRIQNRNISVLLNQAARRIVLIGIIAVLVGCVSAFIFSVAMTRPIGKLVQGATAIGQNKLDTRIEINSKDELGHLAEEFNLMAEKLKELDQMKNDFVSSVSHELRSPLAAVRGYVDYLLKEVAGPVNEQQKEFLVIVKNNSLRLGNFIDSILDVSKIEARKMELNLEPVSLKNIITEIGTLFKPVVQDKKIELVMDLSPDLPESLLDADKINQVLTNLVSNAIKFTPQGGKITVSARPEEKDNKNFIRAEVRDTGIGIAKEDLSKVFEKFQQVGDSKKKTKGPKGTGLGLTIARGIIELHGGKIWVESEVNKGSSFIFEIPVRMEM